MAETVATVVAQGLCTGCGTCLLVCEAGAIRMDESPAGLLRAKVADVCTSCGKCIQVCPGSTVDFGLDADTDPFKGNVRGAFIGHAQHPAVRSGAQSGGVVSALLMHLLDTSAVDAALTTSLPDDGRLRPVPALARNHQAVLEARGSKYLPVAANAALCELPDGERVAAVGVSCHVHGLHRLSQRSPQWADRIGLTIGLFCDRSLLYSASELLANEVDLDPGSLAGLEFRSKARSGWPGEVCFHLSTGGSLFYPSSIRTRVKDYVTLPRCRVCFDKMNILADVSVGDPWGFEHSPDGWSVALARTDRGLNALNEAASSGYLVLQEVDPADVFKGQDVGEKARSFSGFSAAWTQMGRSLPEFVGVGTLCAPVGADATARYRDQLEFNCRVAESQSRAMALAVVRRRRRLVKVRTGLSKVLKKARGRRAS